MSGHTRAVVAPEYGGPEVLTTVEVDPGHPGSGQVLLEVHAAGVNPADWKEYTGIWGTDPAKLPIRLGHEAAGRVLVVGPDVHGLEPGDEVIAHRAPGAYADRIVVRAAACVHKPPSFPWEKAGGLMVGGTTAFHLLEATRVVAGDTLLVHGASGGVGSIAVQLGVARGARVIGTASPRNHDYLRSLGAEPVAHGPGLLDRVRDVAPDGVDAAVDTAGTDEALETSVRLVADRSRVATIAGFAKGSELGVQLLGGGPGADPGTAVRAAARHALVDLVIAGKLDVRVGRTFPLEEAAEAHRAGIAGQAGGRMVLLP